MHQQEGGIVTTATTMGLAALIATAVGLPAQAASWTRLTLPEGVAVDRPADIFSAPAGRPEGGSGQSFRSADGRANLALVAIPNPRNDTPAAFLAARNPPSGIQYRRVTSHFFAVSSRKAGRIWYNRCNFTPQLAHCVLLNYPASEQRQWDAVVTRISLSLSGR
jgi:hypothetical protein